MLVDKEKPLTKHYLIYQLKNAHVPLGKDQQPSDWVYFKQLGLIMNLSLNTVISKINIILSLINYKKFKCCKLSLLYDSRAATNNTIATLNINVSCTITVPL